jgi:hypothetical protein
MRYFIVLRAVYLMAYYFVLSKRPSRLYVLSVLMALSSGAAFTFAMIFVLIFGNKDDKIKFPFEALLFHGLSYEEWRTASEVKKKMSKGQTNSKGETNLHEDIYLILLLVLSFSGLVEFRPQTPEERSYSLMGKLPKKGDVLTSYTFDPSKGDGSGSEKKEYKVDSKEAEMLASIQQKHVEELLKNHYQGQTLSRLVYDGVLIVFKRKKLGQKRPKNANVFMKAFGVAMN